MDPDTWEKKQYNISGSVRYAGDLGGQHRFVSTNHSGETKVHSHKDKDSAEAMAKRHSLTEHADYVAAGKYIPKVGDKIRTKLGGQIPGVVTKVDGTKVHFDHQTDKYPTGHPKSYETHISNVRLDERTIVEEPQKNTGYVGDLSNPQTNTNEPMSEDDQDKIQEGFKGFVNTVKAAHRAKRMQKNHKPTEQEKKDEKDMANMGQNYDDKYVKESDANPTPREKKVGFTNDKADDMAHNTIKYVGKNKVGTHSFSTVDKNGTYAMSRGDSRGAAYRAAKSEIKPRIAEGDSDAVENDPAPSSLASGGQGLKEVHHVTGRHYPKPKAEPKFKVLPYDQFVAGRKPKSPSTIPHDPFPKTNMCPDCEGEGNIKGKECAYCHGVGEIFESVTDKLAAIRAKSETPEGRAKAAKIKKILGAFKKVENPWAKPNGPSKLGPEWAKKPPVNESWPDRDKNKKGPLSKKGAGNIPAAGKGKKAPGDTSGNDEIDPKAKHAGKANNNGATKANDSGKMPEIPSFMDRNKKQPDKKDPSASTKIVLGSKADLNNRDSDGNKLVLGSKKDKVIFNPTQIQKDLTSSPITNPQGSN